MKFNTNLFKTLAASALGMIAVACSQSETDLVSAGDTATQQAKGTLFTADVVLGGVEQEMIANAKKGTRAALSADGTGGLSYTWSQGKTIPLYVYITDGVNHETLSGVELTIKDTDRGQFTFTVPEKYNLANLKVAAATGKDNDAPNGAWATGMDADGTVTIGTPEFVDATSVNYNIPLYAKLTPVPAETHRVGVTFSMLGSWIGVRAKSDMYYTSNLYSVAVESDVLHMDGKLNLSTETPAWTPDDYRINVTDKETTDTINVRGVTIGGNAVGKGSTAYSDMFYVWAKADASKTSTKKPRVYVRDESSAKGGPVYAKTNKYSVRNKFYREADKVTQFADGNTYNFGIDANLENNGEGLMITEYYHSTLAVGNYNWIEITNATNKEISLDGYYLVSPDIDLGDVLYVVDLKNLRALDWRNQGVGYPDRSVTSVPAGESILLAAGEVNSGWAEVLKQDFAYQMVNTRSGTSDISAVSGGIRLPKFLCKGGYNIDFNDPDNNIVDNLGVRVVYEPSSNKFLTSAYYLGNVTFLRSKEHTMNIPQKLFLPHIWNYDNLTWGGLGKYNDSDASYKSLAGYANFGIQKNFKDYDLTMKHFTTRKFRPDADHPSPIK